VQRTPSVPWASGSLAAEQACSHPGDLSAAAAGMPGDTIGLVPLERWDLEARGEVPQYAVERSVFLLQQI